MTYKEFINQVIENLSELYSYSEAKAISVRMLTSLLDITEYEYIVEPGTILSKPNRIKLEGALEDLEKGRPIQYVLGYEYFAGHKFNLNEHVLIPRDETEQLFRLIVEENEQQRYSSLRILDLCTGSGVLAHSLAAYFQKSEVYGCDISLEALKVAESQQIYLDKENKVKNSNLPQFFYCDILDSMPDKDELDIMVSNPPYVRESEKAEMHSNVLDYEPELALFVPDNDPLRYYKALAEIASVSLKSGGKAYMEINEAFSNELRSLFESYGFSDVQIKEDLHGRDRFVTFIKWF